MGSEICQTVIGVDPGHFPGFAVARMHDGEWLLTEVGTIKGSEIMPVLLRHWHEHRQMLVIEDQYLGKLNTVKGLIRDAQDWACCGRLLGYGVERLYPNGWISRIAGPTGTRSKREQRKEIAVQYCRDGGLPVGCLTQDACDAYCILCAYLGGVIACHPTSLAISRL